MANTRRRSSERAGRVLAGAVAVICATWGLGGIAQAGEALALQVIHASSRGDHVDPALKKLIKQFAELKLSSYRLKDSATFDLDLGSAGRMQLPNGEWMTIVPQDKTADGKLRLTIDIAKLQFKTTVAIAPGATLAVGGPPFEDGVLILAVTRPQKSH